MAYQDDEEYEFSECAENAIHYLYPEGLTPQTNVFARYMIELQLALIKCHTATMSPSAKRRSLGTVRFLRNELAMWGAAHE